MTEFTIVLIAAAVILVIAVLILEFSKPKKLNRFEQENSGNNEIQVYYNKELASEESLPSDYHTTEQLIALQAKVNGLGKKTEMAHSRLNDLEDEIVVSKKSIDSEKFSKLEEKLQKLDNFKADAEAELKAMKEIIARQVLAGNPKPENSYEKLRKKDEEYLQSVIFNNRKR